MLRNSQEIDQATISCGSFFNESSVTTPDQFLQVAPSNTAGSFQGVEGIQKSNLLFNGNNSNGIRSISNKNNNNNNIKVARQVSSSAAAIISTNMQLEGSSSNSKYDEQFLNEEMMNAINNHNQKCRSEFARCDQTNPNKQEMTQKYQHNFNTVLPSKNMYKSQEQFDEFNSSEQQQHNYNLEYQSLESSEQNCYSSQQGYRVPRQSAENIASAQVITLGAEITRFRNEFDRQDIEESTSMHVNHPFTHHHHRVTRNSNEQNNNRSMQNNNDHQGSSDWHIEPYQTTTTDENVNRVDVVVSAAVAAAEISVSGEDSKFDAKRALNYYDSMDSIEGGGEIGQTLNRRIEANYKTSKYIDMMSKQNGKHEKRNRSDAMKEGEEPWQRNAFQTIDVKENDGRLANLNNQSDVVVLQKMYKRNQELTQENKRLKAIVGESQMKSQRNCQELSQNYEVMRANLKEQFSLQITQLKKKHEETVQSLQEQVSKAKTQTLLAKEHFRTRNQQLYEMVLKLQKEKRELQGKNIELISQESVMNLTGGTAAVQQQIPFSTQQQQQYQHFSPRQDLVHANDRIKLMKSHDDLMSELNMVVARNRKKRSASTGLTLNTASFNSSTPVAAVVAAATAANRTIALQNKLLSNSPVIEMRDIIGKKVKQKKISTAAATISSTIEVSGRSGCGIPSKTVPLSKSTWTPTTGAGTATSSLKKSIPVAKLIAAGDTESIQLFQQKQQQGYDPYFSRHEDAEEGEVEAIEAVREDSNYMFNVEEHTLPSQLPLSLPLKWESQSQQELILGRTTLQQENTNQFSSIGQQNIWDGLDTEQDDFLHFVPAHGTTQQYPIEVISSRTNHHFNNSQYQQVSNNNSYHCYSKNYPNNLRTISPSQKYSDDCMYDSHQTAATAATGIAQQKKKQYCHSEQPVQRSKKSNSTSSNTRKTTTIQYNSNNIQSHGSRTISSSTRSNNEHNHHHHLLQSKRSASVSNPQYSQQMEQQSQKAKNVKSKSSRRQSESQHLVAAKSVVSNSGKAKTTISYDKSILDTSTIRITIQPNTQNYSTIPATNSRKSQKRKATGNY